MSFPVADYWTNTPFSSATLNLFSSSPRSRRAACLLCGAAGGFLGKVRRCLQSCRAAWHSRVTLSPKTNIFTRRRYAKRWDTDHYSCQIGMEESIGFHQRIFPVSQ